MFVPRRCLSLRTLQKLIGDFFIGLGKLVGFFMLGTLVGSFKFNFAGKFGGIFWGIFSDPQKRKAENIGKIFGALVRNFVAQTFIFSHQLRSADVPSHPNKCWCSVGTQITQTHSYQKFVCVCNRCAVQWGANALHLPTEPETGTVGTMFPESRRNLFSRNRNWNRNRPFLLTVLKHRNPLLQRNSRDRKPEPFEPFHSQTVTELNRTRASLITLRIFRGSF